MKKTVTTRRKAVPEVLKARIEAVRARLGEGGSDKQAGVCDALLVVNARDVRYLTGFVGDDSWAVIRLTGDARAAVPYVLSDERFREQIGREAPHAHLRIRKKGLSDELATLADRLGLAKIGLPMNSITVAMRQQIVKSLGGAGRVKDVKDGMLGQRAVKSAAEVCD